jgi:alanine dehydrogenase
MIIKVKEPLHSEFQYMRKGLLVFTYFHLAPEPDLTKVLLEKAVDAVAYETVELPNRSLPLLTPMSEIAGRMSVQVGVHFLEKKHGGRGVLLGGVPGVPAAEVVIVGGGVVGTNAAKMAVGLGAKVTIIDVNLDRLRYLDDIFGARITTLASNSYNIAEAVKDRRPRGRIGPHSRAKAPKLVTEAMVKNMMPGSVMVDVAIDQGGCIEPWTMSLPTRIPRCEARRGPLLSAQHPGRGAQGPRRWLLPTPLCLMPCSLPTRVGRKPRRPTRRWRRASTR